jgi:hypothetical protein
MFKKHICIIIFLKQLNRLLVPRDYALLPNNDSILYFQYLFSLFIFQDHKGSAINVGPVGFEASVRVPFMLGFIRSL